MKIKLYLFGIGVLILSLVFFFLETGIANDFLDTTYHKDEKINNIYNKKICMVDEIKTSLISLQNELLKKINYDTHLVATSFADAKEL